MIRLDPGRSYWNWTRLPKRPLRTDLHHVFSAHARYGKPTKKKLSILSKGVFVALSVSHVVDATASLVSEIVQIKISS